MFIQTNENLYLAMVQIVRSYESVNSVSKVFTHVIDLVCFFLSFMLIISCGK